MRRLMVIASVVTLLAGSLQAQASNWRRAGQNHVNATCHEKIDPKNLKGDQKKAAWKACKEDPDSYT